MKHRITLRSLATVAIALGALAAASSAQARSDVTFSVGVQVPGVYVQPAPVYVTPRAYYAPAPHYNRHFDQGRHYSGQNWKSRGPYGDRDRDGIPNMYDAGHQRGQWQQARLYGPYGDRDRDGVVNRYDRDRDGDGTRNRFDRLPDSPHRR